MAVSLPTGSVTPVSAKPESAERSSCYGSAVPRACPPSANGSPGGRRRPGRPRSGARRGFGDRSSGHRPAVDRRGPPLSVHRPGPRRRGCCRRRQPDVSASPTSVADSRAAGFARPRSRRSGPSRRSCEKQRKAAGAGPQGRSRGQEAPRGRPRRPGPPRSTSRSARSTSWAASTPPRAATGRTTRPRRPARPNAAGVIAKHGVDILGTQELQSRPAPPRCSPAPAWPPSRASRWGSGRDRQLDPLRRRACSSS